MRRRGGPFQSAIWTGTFSEPGLHETRTGGILGGIKGYGQFCPVAKAAEVLAERWTPLILRELLSGSRRFNDIRRGVPLMSRSLLSKRLRELEDAGVIERRTARGDSRAPEYHPTAAGEELRTIIEGLGAWGQRWIVADVEEEDLDPALLMWDIRRNLRRDEPPRRRVVVRFRLTDVTGAQGQWWLLVDEEDADLCMTDPGFDVELDVKTTLLALTRYWVGRRSWHQLLRNGELELEGPRWLQRRLPKWLGRSDLSGIPHQGTPVRTG